MKGIAFIKTNLLGRDQNIANVRLRWGMATEEIQHLDGVSLQHVAHVIQVGLGADCAVLRQSIHNAVSEGVVIAAVVVFRIPKLEKRKGRSFLGAYQQVSGILSSFVALCRPWSLSM